MSSEPPEEPLSRSEYSILSPASPKPIHFPAPTNIPILDMQTDVGFNQMEPHMSDPATRNTETRPDMWQDPNEQPAGLAQQPTTDASPYSTGADASKGSGQAGAEEPQREPSTRDGEVVEEISASTTNAQPEVIPTSASDEAATTGNGMQPSPTGAPTMLSGAVQAVADANNAAAAAADTFSAQTDEVKLDQPAPQQESGAIDIQGLLKTLQAAPAPGSASFAADGMPTSQPSESHHPSSEHPNAPTAPGVEAGSSPLSASNLGVPPSGLPPRPPPQEQPLINPNYAHSQHIRDYHPHAAHSASQSQGQSGSQNNAADPNGRSFAPPFGSPGANTQASHAAPSSATYPPAVGANGQAQGSYATSPASALSSFTPNQSTFPFQYPQGVAGSTPGAAAARHAGRRPEDRPWDAEVQRKYDRFLEEERRYVAEGRWEQFPQGSRLFVGNLSSEKVTKRDIFHVFHTYGELAQISIKQAYGFVQFLRAEDCTQALEAEQGTQIRDKKIHLEVSKPQKNRPQPQRRSRSPPDQRNRQGAADRYNGGRGGSNRRDDYRPSRRSPSPRGYRDRYDDRYRRRSPSPQGYGGRGGRYRSPTPRRDDGDDLPLPRREPRDVPEVQIVVLDSLDRDFIGWVEQAFASRGVRVDVLLLSPRLSEPAVVRCQIVEGVLAVVKLTRQNQNTGQIGLQIFDRSAGAGNVRFEEYDNLPPPTCAELVLREKSKVAAPSHGAGYSSYGQSMPQPPQQQPYGYPPQQQPGYPPTYNQPPPPQGSVPPHLQSLITNLDPQNLQSLLSAMHTPQSAASNPYGAAPNSAVQALQQNPQLAGYLQQQGQRQAPPQQQQQQRMPPTGPGGAAAGAGQVNMQEILARLGSSGGGGGR